MDKPDTISCFPQNKIFMVDNLMNMTKRTQTGFTLLEMILVLAIMASILGLITNYGSQRMNQFRRDRTAAQMQQILNAGLAYYVSNGTWPVVCGTPATLSGSSTLQTSGYLPAVNITSPYSAGAYTIDCSSTTGLFKVSTVVSRQSEAQIMSGQLPMVTTAIYNSGPQYTVTAQVNIPGQNLNNARSVNFGSLYHHGACVPAPSCPAGMSPQIIVVPGAIAGVAGPPTASDGTTTNCTSTVYSSTGSIVTSGSNACRKIKYYPIDSFAAYATGPSAATSAAGPTSCDGLASPPCYQTITSGANNPANKITDGNKYWRVCLSVYTESGAVSIAEEPQQENDNTMYWTHALGYVFATTRCTPTAGEPSGSDFNAFGY